MGKVTAIVVAIIIIVALVAIFIISYIAYRRTPKPEGCDDIPDEEVCNSCKEKDGCALNIYRDKEEKK